MKRSLNSHVNEVISHINGVITGIIRIATSKEKLRKHLQTPLYENAYYLIAGSVAAAFLGFVFWMIVARFYSPSEVGLACALISVMGMLTSFSTLGLHIGLIRFLPEERDKRGMINSCLTMPGICAVALAVVFISGLGFWTPKLLFLRENFFYLLCFIIFTVASSIFLVQKNVFVALRSTKFNLVQRVVWNGLKIAFPIALVSLGAFGIFSSCGITLCVTVIIGTLLIRKVQSGYYPLPVIKKHMINDMMHFSFGNYIIEFIGTASIYILPLMVLGILGAETTAYFYIAFTISSMMFMISGAVGMSLFAEGSYEFEKLRTNVIRSMNFMFILLLPLLAIILLFGDKILLLFGKAYSENAFTLLRILALSSIPLVVNELYVGIKRVQKKIKPILYYSILALVLILGVSYLLMPKFGLIGVGIGWLLGQGVIAAMRVPAIAKEIRMKEVG